MAGFDYGRMQATASRLLERFNQGTVTLTRHRYLPGPNDWTPGKPATKTYALDATVKGVSEEYIDGTLIKVGDLEVTAAALEIEPQAGDVLTIDGDDATVLRVVRLPSAGVVVAWKLLCRGGVA